MVILLLILVLIIFYLLWTRRIHPDTTLQIKTLIRSCSRWSLASLQDKSPLIAILHANYGAGYLWALQEIFTDSQIREATGVDIKVFTKMITDIQDYATRNLAHICTPFIENLDPSLLKIAGEV